MFIIWGIVGFLVICAFGALCGGPGALLVALCRDVADWPGRLVRGAMCWVRR